MYLVPFSKVCRVMTRRRSNILISAILAILYFATSAFALHEHQAGTFDWHHAWVGKSTWSTTLGQDTVIVGTERNVLAALDTQSGAIKWRQLLQGHATTFEQVASGILTVIDNPPKVQMWDAHSGFLQWEHPFNYRNVSATALIDSSSSALLDAIIIAANSQVVSKISAADGQSVWTTQRHEKTAGGDEIVSLHIRKQQLYVVERLQVESVIQVTVVDVETGDIVKTNKISTAPAIHNLVVTGDYIVWTEKDTVNWAEVGAKKAQSTTITTLAKSVASFAFIEPQTLEIKTVDKESDLLYMTAVTLEEEKVAVATSLFRIQPKTLALLTDLGIQEDAGAVDMLDSTLARFTSAGKELVVDSLTISPVDGSASVEEKQTIAHDSLFTGNVVFAKVINVSPLRALVVTASGSTFMYDQEKMAWSREEAMAHTTASEFLELPEKQLWTQMADELSESLEEQEHIQPLTRYLRRLQVHASEMKNLPNWLLSRLIGSTAQSNNGPQSKRDPAAVLQAQSCWMNATAPTTTIYRDNFGLRKLLISVTDTGKIIAQDSANKGQIVWSRYFKDVQFTHVFVVRSVSVKLPPIIVAMGVSGPDGYWETHLYRLNALTGEYYISTVPDADQYFEPVLITETQVAKVMRLPIEEPDERTHILALYEAGSNRVYIYPDGEGARASFRKFINDFYFVRQSKNGSFKGYKVQEGYRGSLNAVPVWTLDLTAADETVVAVGERQQYEKVALIGRALGNRNVLYKYLNPHMFAIITANAERQTMTVRLVDAVKGTVFYEVVHQNVDAVNNSVHVAQAENWVVYHFWSNDPKAHGYQAVVLELFEGRDENERVASTNFSSYDNIQPNVLSGAFMFPYPVQTMGVTTTRNGVSTREIIFGLSTHQIMNVNKRLLDPRRPVTDKPSKEQVEEGLIPYGPIPDERQMFLTYNLEVLGIKHIATSPALLESTSLVFAYGLDTFFSRSSPSKRFDVLSEDFSKSQLLLTILGLVVAILISGPMVRRKQVNTLWK